MGSGEMEDRVPNSSETNGVVTNGHHKSGDREKSHSSSHKHKHKGKDKEKDRERSKDKDRSKDKHKDKHKEKHREKDREKHKSKSKDKDREREREKDKERRDKDKHRSKDKEKEKEKKSPEKEIVKEAEESRVKPEPMSDDEDIPLSSRVKHEVREDLEEDDAPLSARKKVKEEPVVVKEEKEHGKKRKAEESDDDDEDFTAQKKKEKLKKKDKGKTKDVPASPTKKSKKEKEEEVETWKWWEEERRDDGVKWSTLQHKGPVFAPEYEPLPSDVKFFYAGKHMKLSTEAEEVATFYGKMLDHDYTTKEIFNKNFFKDWRKFMTSKEKEIITDLTKCDFSQMNTYFKAKSEERKQMTKEEKQKIKVENEALVKEYGWCVIDGHKQRIGNFKIEPPGLFRGRGDHPKMGMIKRRVQPEDVIINCGKGSAPKPPEGHKWKEVRHDNTVTWLASWTENVQGQVKYIMLNSASRLKGERDWQKYEIARKLKSSVDTIRENYKDDWKSKEMKVRQRAVALYFIDKLALRAGNEKDEDQADTVGCCSLRVEHISLHEEKDGKQCVVVFDFLGKDSIRYYNEVPVEKRVFKNLQIFMENKKPEDDLFDRLNTTILNKHLNDLMEGLTAKVFRTYNASNTLQEQLDKLTDAKASVAEKILAYNRANRAVAILCNHQRAVPKTFAKSMENMQKKIDAKRDAIAEAEASLKDAKKQAKKTGSVAAKTAASKKEKQLERLKEQLNKLEVQATDREENKEIALGTSKLNYLDPRITVAWCKKYGVPVEKIYNKTQREKFQWAIDMAGPEFKF